MKMLLTLMVLLALPVTPRAHEWFPSECCSGKDCKVLHHRLIRATPKGWHVLTNDDVIPYGDPRIRRTAPEGGGRFYLCTPSGELADKTTRCLFTPEMRT